MLDQIIQDGKMVRDESQREYARDLIGEFVNQVLAEGGTTSGDVAASINDRIAEIDDLLSAQLNEILHNEDFQALEASWRGLHHLVMNSETGTMLKLRVLKRVARRNSRRIWRRLSSSTRASFSRRSTKTNTAPSAARPTARCSPISISVVTPQDLAFVEKLSQVAAAAHAPMITAASPRLFDMDSFTDLGTPRDPRQDFRKRRIDQMAELP